MGSISDFDIETLKKSVQGEVIVKGQCSREVYQEAITRWNHVFTKEATIVVYVENEHDVVQCIRYVRKMGIDLAVAGGRHALKGTSSSDGLVIDLRKMRKVIVDKAGKRVIAQGGCLGRDIDDAAWEQGLSVVSGTVSQTGIGGLTQGGGLGWLTGQYGLMIDNLLKATVVLADGRIVTTSEKNEPDLFWAIRGCGANFGVITEFVYRAHDQGMTLTGFLVYSPDQHEEFLSLADALCTDLVPNSAGKLAAMVIYSSPPPTLTPHPVFFVFYDGPEDEARQSIRKLYDITPILDTTAMNPYADVNGVNKVFDDQLDNTFFRHAVSGAKVSMPFDRAIFRNMWESYKVVIPQYPKAFPTHIVVQVDTLDVVQSVRNDETAYANRGPWCNMLVHAIWNEPEDDETLRKWTLDLGAEIRAANDKKGLVDQRVLAYPNYSSGDEKAERMFGANYDRLSRLKAVYDPEMLFNKWYPVKPRFD